MSRIAVAAISARALAEAATADGFEVIALDLFGDRDTRRAATRWQAIGEASRLQIDAVALLDALGALARDDTVQGWIAGSGFDGLPELLEAGAQRLPLIGNDAATLRRVRDPRGFFGLLDALGIAHPPVRHELPADPQGWLLKDAAGCGGWHIRRAGAASRLEPTQYLQREQAGVPMSATFVANGRSAVVLGCNAQVVRRVAGAPFVFCGVIGPVPVDEVVQRQVGEALRALVPALGLQGLGSLDFLLEGDRVDVLELNPRPPASLALYAQAEGGPLRAHVRACERGELPSPVAGSRAPRGHEIVFARRRLQIDAQGADWLAAQPGVHDLPRSATVFAAGDPVCSVEAGGDTAAAVREQLAQRREALLSTLENLA